MIINYSIQNNLKILDLLNEEKERYSKEVLIIDYLKHELKDEGIINEKDGWYIKQQDNHYSIEIINEAIIEIEINDREIIDYECSFKEY